MKCVIYTDGEVVRVKNIVAQKLVEAGKAMYINKEEWKRCGRKYYRGQAPQEVNSDE